MNIFDGIYCNQYYELKKKGREAEARKYGNAILTIALVLNLLTIFLLLVGIFPDFADSAEDLAKDVFGRSNGRSIGKVIGLIPFVVIYPIVRFIVGSEKRYDKIIERFKKYPDAEQEQISKKALRYFIISCTIIFIPIIIFLIKGM